MERSLFAGFVSFISLLLLDSPQPCNNVLAQTFHTYLDDGQCPQRGCFDCPSYRAPGENPFFKKKAKAGQHTRAKHFIDNGDVDLWRKTADL